MSRRLAVQRVSCTVLAVAALVMGATPASAAGADDPSTTGTVKSAVQVAADDLAAADDDALPTTVAYPGNPVTEPALVADEEDRLADVQTVGRMIQWGKLPVLGAYRLSTGSAYTLVLTRRSEQYGLADLLKLAPQTFVREPDGAYLLMENIVIQPGARLQLRDTGALTIKMASDTDRFVSIVNLGGELEIVGTKASPVTLTSWDRDAGRRDTATEDGRAYVRSVGGKVTLERATFSDLGFWSGRTGGVALTGVDRPSEGALEEYGRDLGDAVAANNHATGVDVRDGTVPGGTSVVSVEEQLRTATEGSPVEGLLPVGTLPVPYTDDEDPEYSYVSAKVENAAFEGNAFGLFVSSANGVDISGSTIKDSLVDGLVMHRYVVNAAVADTVSSNNAGHGIVLARATTGIVVTEVTSRRNGGSGIVVRGAALANGPSATGMPIGDYGNNSISNSSADDNARFGIEIIGGRNVNLSSNDVAGNDMGIVIREAASEVTLVGNHLKDNVRHSVALRDGSVDVGITGNVISGSLTGVHVRDSSAVVERNTLNRLTNHAVTVVGATSGTVIEQNTISGRGPSAVDVKRADAVTVSENDLAGWESTKPFWTVVRNAMQPLTIMWLSLGLVLLTTALKGTRHRMRGIRHPYEAQRRLAEIVEPPIVPGAGTAFVSGRGSVAEAGGTA